MKKLWYQQKYFKYGLPFLILVTGGSFALKEFTTLRYEYSKNKQVSPAELEKLGVKMKKPGEVTLESEYEKIKALDIDSWDNKRGPRPWEENFPEKKS
ncbi:cytochrome c oxidase assembly protein COX16 homolog, mitochondrial [Phlebotomus papatasi]|uniref:Cytochrome c oxidase assembly protein COX16 homolog, mitochondrial n=1 Tax=Phlebotomus papatasi TaxID=29031 RepID=A0A1B0D933_PHLPP|nr:cytochrome c oxidase assembly protein COX16 homolog, mitochondrial [Phlebotomus papatasi]